MAMKIADYYPRFRRRLIWLGVLLQGLILVCLASLLSYLHLSLSSILLIILPVVLLQVISLGLFIYYALGPLNILSRAIAHVSNETNDVVPPNVNGTLFEKSGIKTMVDTIYGLALNDGSAKTASPNTLDTTILERLPVGIAALDENRNIIYANAAAPVKTDDKGARSLSLLFQGDDNLETWLAGSEKDSVTAEHSWSRIQTALPDDQNRQICDVIAQYHKKGSGGIETLIVTVDRTAHYAVDEEDMDFIALAAHELRGPITVIRGYLEILNDELEPQIQPDQQELFKRLTVSANRLSGYVSNILNVSRFDRRHLQFHLREERLSNVYALIADDLALRASTQNRILSVIIPPDLPTIAADRNSLTEVLANLVDNAIKYSHEGGTVEVTASADASFVTLSVTDHGIGIPSTVVGHLFSKFYRSHRSRQAVSGTGLGLYISKAIIESHGGTMSVSSQEGTGSTFRFSVPIYATVADRLLKHNNGNMEVIETSNGWIKNHSMFRG